MAKVQTGHGYDGTQVDITGEEYAVLITTDDAPRVSYVQKGKNSVSFILETGEKVWEAPWLLSSGTTEEEAWENYKE